MPITDWQKKCVSKRCQIWSLVKIGQVVLEKMFQTRTDGQKFLIRVFKWCLGKKSKKRSGLPSHIAVPYRVRLKITFHLEFCQFDDVIMTSFTQKYGKNGIPETLSCDYSFTRSRWAEYKIYFSIGFFLYCDVIMTSFQDFFIEETKAQLFLSSSSI